MNKSREAKIWSLSTRIFHWSLVMVVFLAAVTSSSDRWLDLHITMGFMALILVIWRICYGFLGSYYSRFRSFLVPPKKVTEYLKKLAQLNPPQCIGHNPIHGWMIIAFFAVISLLFLSGVIINIGEENQSGLWRTISIYAGELFKEIHETLAALFGIMIFIHICGVFTDSFLHKTNLIKSMITGKKVLSETSIYKCRDECEPVQHSIKGILILFLTLIIVGGIYFNNYTPGKPVIELAGAGYGWELWKSECSDCHEAFHPSLLPERSWEKLMNKLNSHFGDDASLENEERKVLTEFLVKYAAENSNNEAAYKINNSIPGSTAPVRITETPYWEKKHLFIGGDIYGRKSVKRKSNCSSCHMDANSGEYEDDLILIPSE